MATIAITAANVRASVGFTPKSTLFNDEINRPAISDSTTPAATPIAVSCKPDFSTMLQGMFPDEPLLEQKAS